MKKTFAIFLIFNLFCFSVFSQTITSDAGMTVPDDRIRTDKETFASDEFRRGVQAYYKGAFNEAIVQFEKALSYMPNDNLILEWLGKAYYKTGVEGSALQYWQTANDNGYGGLLLQNKIEIVRERRVTGDSKDKLMRLSEAGSFPGEFNGQLIFSGPVSVLPNPNGTMYIVTYNSNQIILMNQNGKVIDRITGPMNGFDRPSDIIRLKDGNILVSETFGDRLALLDKNAKFIKYIGKKGRQLGEVVGPLYLAQDDLERIYVTDSGNRRVDVFDKEGNALFFFGGKQNGFSGLKMPTGITVFEDKVFVVDSDLGTIYEFDTAGNYKISFTAKADSALNTNVDLWCQSKEVTTCSIPLELTSEYKTFTFVVPVHKELIGTSNVNINMSTTAIYLKDLKVEKVEDSFWTLYQSDEILNVIEDDPTSVGHMAILDSSDSSVKIYRNARAMKTPAADSQYFVYTPKNIIAGDYKFVFTDSSYTHDGVNRSKSVFDTLLIRYKDGTEKEKFTGFTDSKGTYFAKFTVSDEDLEKGIEFVFQSALNWQWITQYFILNDVAVKSADESVEGTELTSSSNTGDSNDNNSTVWVGHSSECTCGGTFSYEELSDGEYKITTTGYSATKSIIIATDVNEEIVAQISERNSDFPGISISTEASRTYLAGNLAAHIIGYTGKIKEEEYQEFTYRELEKKQ